MTFSECESRNIMFFQLTLLQTLRFWSEASYKDSIPYLFLLFFDLVFDSSNDVQNLRDLDRFSCSEAALQFRASGKQREHVNIARES